jgi:hypothetical protein
MSFQDLSAFLERFKNIRPPAGVVRQALSDAISDLLHQKLSVDHIKVQHEIAFLRSNPFLRTEVSIRKQEIISRVEERSGIRLRDIR